MGTVHQSVMTAEILAGLRVTPGGTYVDCTIGDGGHTHAILGAGHPPPRVLGIDIDSEAVDRARRRLEEYGGLTVVAHDSYTALGQIAGKTGFLPADGILFDLGVSTLQLDSEERGFSFSKNGRLDMRFDVNQDLDAHAVVNGSSEKDLADIIYQFGEEPRARRVARGIVLARPIESTVELAQVIAESIGRSRGRIHPATRAFQALRIAVNHELDNLHTGLEQAVGILRHGGRLVVSSYHSLEDRIVKEFMKRESSSCVCPVETPVCTCTHTVTMKLINRKVTRPSKEETLINRRSRSARLRVAERL